jgi:hypothetical protein
VAKPFTTSSNGIASTMPAIPQTQNQKTRPKTTVTALSCVRRPTISGVMKLPSSAATTENAAGAARTSAKAVCAAPDASNSSSTFAIAPR